MVLSFLLPPKATEGSFFLNETPGAGTASSFFFLSAGFEGVTFSIESVDSA